MSIFGKKEPPKACPKCGKADGWALLPFEPLNPADAGQLVRKPGAFVANDTFYAQKGPDGAGVKRRYHCQNCGYENSY